MINKSYSQYNPRNNSISFKSLNFKIKYGLFLLCVGFTGPIRPRTLTAYQSIRGGFDINYLIDIIYWLLVAIYVIPKLFYKNRTKNNPSFKIEAFSPTGIYLIFSTYAIISSIYSSYFLYTLYFSLKLLLSFFLIIVLYKKYNVSPFIILKTIYFIAIIIVSIEFILYLISPETVGTDLIDVGFRLTGGIFGDYGFFSAFVIFFIVFEKTVFKIRLANIKKIIFLIALVILFLARTRETYIELFIWLVMILIFNKKRILFKTFILNILLTVIFLLFSQTILAYIFRGQNIEGLITLSGRTIVLENILSLKLSSIRLLIGSGFEAGSRFALESLKYDLQGFGAAHDVISKTYLDLGILGLFIISVCYIMFGVRAWKLVQKVSKYAREYRFEFFLSLFLFGTFIFFLISIPVSSEFVSVNLKVPFYLVTVDKLYQKFKYIRRN